MKPPPPTAWLAALVLLARAAGGAELTVEVRDSRGTPVADAVVYAEPVGTTPSPPAPDARATIDQVNKEFVPRVSVVRAGSQVFFPNSDHIRHSIYSFSPAKTFATKLYSGKEAPPVLFDKTGVVVLGCNIHDTMVAWVVIVDTPWFGKSAADGVVTMRALPAGEYHVTASAPAVPLAARRLTLRLDAPTARQVITLETGS